jgi:translation initiation factor 6 (eIF-6)
VEGQNSFLKNKGMLVMPRADDVDVKRKKSM